MASTDPQDFYKTNGTSALETFQVILPSCLTIFISLCVTTLLMPVLSHRKQFLVEFLIICIPAVLSVTILTGSAFILSLIVGLGIVIALVMRNSKARVELSTIAFGDGNKPFISHARGLIYLLTKISILAVDFQIFPRRFAKTESYGYSLMDVGVGLFIVSTSVTSRTRSFQKSLTSNSILLALGVLRYVATDQTNYNVHVYEYGVHWNFFMTLAFTKLIGDSVQLLVRSHLHVFIVAVVLGWLQVVILWQNSDWIISDASRDGVISANREGIFSLLGYVVIYLVASVIYQTINPSEARDFRQYKKMLYKSTIYTGISLVALFVTSHYQVPSRRLVNFPYIVWIVFITNFMITFFLLTEILIRILLQLTRIKKHEYSSLILSAINYNGLLYFLLANVLTGCVNLMVNTQVVSPIYSFGILLVYSVITSGIITICYSYKIKVKFL